MKALFRKTLCIISGAIMLCGASAIHANAGPELRPGNIEMPQISEPGLAFGGGRQMLRLGYYLNSNSFEITPSETANIEVKSDVQLPFGKVATYQWYKDGKPITGATSKTYPATEAGEYYCEVTERNREINVKETTTTTTASLGFRPAVTRTTTVGIEPAGTRKTTTVVTNRQIEDIGQLLTPVTTNLLPIKVSSVQKYTTDTATVKKVSELKIKSQSDTYQELKYNTQLFVNPTGGSGKYTYRWTDAKGDWAGSDQKLSVESAGIYKCEVKDSSNRKAYSKEINVKYVPMYAYTYIDYSIFTESEPLNAEKTINTRILSGGTGKYDYCWQIYEDGQWKNTGCYNSSMTIKKDDIKNRHLYWDYNKQRNCQTGYNRYRCIIRSLNCKGKVIESVIDEIYIGADF